MQGTWKLSGGRVVARIVRRARRNPIQHRVLTWLRDHVHQDIPRWYYTLVLGHDLHLSIYATLSARHYRHVTGVWKDLGVVSRHKVTTAWRDFVVAQMVAETAEFGDAKFHEVGTSSQAESNADTALITPTGIARVTGTQVDAGSGLYRSVGTVTADTTETWTEHGIFTKSTGTTLLDRSLISPTVAVVANDQVQFTYELTVNAEA